MSFSLSPLIQFGTSTWTYEGWQDQVNQQHVIVGVRGERQRWGKLQLADV